MAAQNIVKGPSRWDIMLGFFEKKELTFTLEDGTVIKMKYVDGMMNMHGYDPLVGDMETGDCDYWNGGIAEGYLLRGPNSNNGNQEVFIEYRVRSRRGLCAVVTDKVADEGFLPSLWSKIMGLEGNYDPN